MAVNHMAEVAAMFGVGLGERFKIINVDTNKPISEYNYYFTDKDIEIEAIYYPPSLFMGLKAKHPP